MAHSNIDNSTTGDMSDYDSPGDSDIEDLMSLLDDCTDDYDYSHASKFVQSVSLDHFDFGPDGYLIHRDKTVLGFHTGITIPSEMCKNEVLKLTFLLDHAVDLNISTTVKAPKFMSDNLLASSSELSRSNSLKINELWVRPSELTNGKVLFKTRDWRLSGDFRNVTGERMPKFYILVTGYSAEDGILKKNSSMAPIRSPSFVVRSKDNRASNGKKRTVRTRRTPETQARACRLNEVQTEIVNLGKQIEHSKQIISSLETNFRFMSALSVHEPMAENIYRLVQGI